MCSSDLTRAQRSFTRDDDDRLGTRAEPPDAAHELDEARLRSPHPARDAQEGYAHRRPIITTLSDSRRGDSAAIDSG